MSDNRPCAAGEREAPFDDLPTTLSNARVLINAFGSVTDSICVEMLRQLDHQIELANRGDVPHSSGEDNVLNVIHDVEKFRLWWEFRSYPRKTDEEIIAAAIKYDLITCNGCVLLLTPKGRERMKSPVSGWNRRDQG